MSSNLEITCDLDPDGRTVLTLRGEVELATAAELREALMARLPESAGLVLDVSGAVLVDAAGLRVLVAAQREAAALGKAPIVLRGVRPLFAKTLQITGLDHLFEREPAPVPTLAGAAALPLVSLPARRRRPSVALGRELSAA